jgi:hypothetical protein
MCRFVRLLLANGADRELESRTGKKAIDYREARHTLGGVPVRNL